MESDDGDLTKIILRALSKRYILNAIVASTTTLLLYDWLLILPLEIEYIWSAPWKWAKVLYLLIRYIPFVNLSLVLQIQFSKIASAGTCEAIVHAVCWLSLLEVDLVEVVLALRTYAVWNEDRRVGIGLGLLLVLCQIPSGAVLSKFIQTIDYIQNLYPQFYQGCQFISTTRLVILNWVIFVIVEGAVLVLMIISASKSYHGNTSYLTRVVYMDGIRFYVYSFCVMLTDILLIMSLPLEFVVIGSNVQVVLHSILACRLMIGIREARESSERKRGTIELPRIAGGNIVEVAREPV